MSEMKTLKFPGDTEPREIVDAKAREAISRITDEHINSLIDAKLGVIENGSY